MGRTYRQDGNTPSKKYKRNKRTKKKEKFSDDNKNVKDETYFWWDNQDYGGNNDFERFSGRRKK